MGGADASTRYDAGLSLLFAPGARPGGDALRRALDACQVAVQVAEEAPAAGLVELLVNGLGFDAVGICPGAPSSPPLPRDSFAFSTSLKFEELEAISIFPGPHLDGGAALPPVTRSLLALAAELAVLLPVRAVSWHPARTAMEPAYFSRSVLAWLAGGAFPVLGLGALAVGSDGSVASRGLAHFVGQEVLLRPIPGKEPQDMAKLAIRVVDRIAREGPLRMAGELTCAGETLCAEPVERGKLVWVWRGG
jgi:hypothetical protein